jgi:CheY-like chemotaxis protein
VRRPDKTSAAVLAFTTDPEVRDLLMELAIAEGFGVRCAASEAEAEEILDLERPGLVLVDLDMPSRAGTKFLRSFRQGPLGEIPCIAVTASNDPMLAVSVDASIFYKPDLDGIDAAIGRLFWPDGSR